MVNDYFLMGRTLMVIVFVPVVEPIELGVNDDVAQTSFGLSLPLGMETAIAWTFVAVFSASG